MSVSLQGILIFGVISIISATIWHTFLIRFSIAILGAAITAAFAFQFFSYIKFGYLDPFFVISIFTTTIAAFVIAIFVGLPFRVWRKNNGTSGRAAT